MRADPGIMTSDVTSLTATETDRRRKTRASDLVPRHRTLDGFIEAVSKADGIGLTDLDAFTTVVVRTDNSLYQITILQPHTREVVVQGGAFFRTRTRAWLNGSSFGGSCLKLGWVGLGLHLEFHTHDQWVITSHVRSIAIEPSTDTRPV